MDATIVIPTKNAGSVLDKVLKSIFQQKTEYSFEVICVDSGSKDNTLEIIAKYPVKLLKIEPSEFGHGKTRNYGASQGTGEYILFITQDAVPVNEFWLDEFLKAMKLDPEIVGGFGKHLPYPDCNLFDKRDITIHFDGFGKENTVYFLADKERYKVEEGYRHLLAYYSDNNSCMKRSIWERYPYDDVNFAEDQIWARKMIELGYKKVYCPSAMVYHSHNFKLSTYLKRYFDEYKGLYELHQFQIAPNVHSALKQCVLHFLSEVKYVLKQDLSFFEKIKWINYSFWRNQCRYIGGYLGGKYYSYSDKKKQWLDKHISQQYKQRKA